MANENRLSSQFSPVCDLEENFPKVSKNLSKREKPQKTKPLSVRSGKTRITSKIDLNEKITKLNAKNKIAKELKQAEDCSTMS